MMMILILKWTDLQNHFVSWQTIGWNFTVAMIVPVLQASVKQTKMLRQSGLLH